ncbi:MAG: glycosyltransferase family A protein [Polyangiaceae bacterium]
MRLYQDLEDVEILIVDNFGCTTSSAFVAGTGLGDGVRIVQFPEKTGTRSAQAPRVRRARGDAVLCIDAHVLLAPRVSRS